MRRILVIAVPASLLCVAFLLPAEPASAGNDPPGAGNKPPAQAQPITIADVRRKGMMNGAGMRWSGGALEYEVDLVNPGPPSLNVLKVQHGNQFVTPTKQSATIATGKSTAVVSDPAGVDDCRGSFIVRFAVGDDSEKWTNARVESNCVLRSVEDPTAPASGERAAEQAANKLTFYDAKLLAEPACGTSTMKFQATVRNRSNIATRAELDIVPPAGMQRITKRVVFDIAPGEMKTLSGFGVENFNGQLGKYTMELRELNGTVGVYNTGWGVTVARMCAPRVVQVGTQSGGTTSGGSGGSGGGSGGSDAGTKIMQTGKTL